MEPLNIKDMYLSDFKKIENIYDTEFPNTWKHRLARLTTPTPTARIMSRQSAAMNLRRGST